MVTLTIKLTWPDGDTLTARMQAATPEGDNPVIYSGATTRIPNLFTDDSAPTLSAYLRQMAKQAGAEIEENWDGQYAQWAK